MKVWRDPARWDATNAPVVTVGSYDGVHRGHRSILARTREKAEELGAPTLVLCFVPHPARIVRPESAPLHITTAEQREELLGEEGMENLLLYPFDAELASRSPAEFAREVLAERLGCRHVVVGGNFRFGHDRAGTVEELRRLGEELGFGVEGVELACLPDGTRVSSTHIRDALQAGRIERVNEMLGRVHTLVGTCVHGQARGRTLGFPTANLEPENELIPADGVYVTETEVEGMRHHSVTNIGVRPTFGGGVRVIESHLLRFQGELHARRLTLHLHRRLREERSFASPDELRAQIEADVARARTYLESLEG